MEAVCLSETSVYSYQTTWRHILDGSSLCYAQKIIINNNQSYNSQQIPTVMNIILSLSDSILDQIIEYSVWGIFRGYPKLFQANVGIVT